MVHCSITILHISHIISSQATSEVWYFLWVVLNPYFSVYVPVHPPTRGSRLTAGHTHRRLPNLLVNRLYLNLRVSYLPRSAVSNNDDAIMPEPAFARNRFLGNIGAPLDPDWWNTRFDEDDLEFSNEVAEANPENSVASAELGNGATTLIPVVRDVHSYPLSTHH